MKQFISTMALIKILTTTTILLPKQASLLVKQVELSKDTYSFQDILDKISRAILDTPYDHLPVSVQMQLKDVERELK